MKVIWTKSARGDLSSIYLYYKEKVNSKIARKIRSTIFRRTDVLKRHPFAGQQEEMLKVLQEGHRYLVKGNYKIIYKITEKKVFITQVFDARQDPQKLLQKERD
ncbi:MAG: type II toxin-antitoxin system RelE/ParE family toxin [Cytophagales bacterium]|nr:type II toxin-antitoxin system RelE/ParE family toxin [Cytophagales bacterium]